VILPALISWSEHSNPGVKYFSGTATYRSKLVVPKTVQVPDRGIFLDLGRVAVIAQVKLNGRDLGILWKPPFTVDVTEVLRAGTNDLEVRVVNLWINRLIGDEQLPDDCEWTKGPFGEALGEVLKEYPEWLKENKPRTSGRVTFTTWKHWHKTDPLMESGLLGPVRIVTRARVPVEL
jgi:hypothetical protein